MKFPRNAKILRSHFDVAPFAAVFFLLVIFLMLGALIPTAGIPLKPLQPLQPPDAVNLPGTDQPTVAMAVDAEERLYFENQIRTERVLQNSLIVAAQSAREPLTLIIHADKGVSYQMLAHLSVLARDCGITNILLATLPRVEAAPARP
jgi:biopolymer transport protein ExbD